MLLYILFLIASVFVGTELIGISSPLGQITIYRILAMGLPLVLFIQLWQRNPRLKIDHHNPATFIVGVYLFWILWAMISGAWAWQLKNWIQACFLLAIGVISILAIYLWVNDFKEWSKAISVAWLMMSLLVFWGLYEITTNHYILANLNKLDPHQVFDSYPWARIPITSFANQNDYATLLIAYLPLSLIMYTKSRLKFFRFSYLFMVILAIFLIYRSESRMILLSLILFFLIYFFLDYLWDLPNHWIKRAIVLSIIILIVLIVFIEPIRERMTDLFYIGGDIANTGDSRRVNLWRNGLIFLGQTFGFGVGAGNIEVWMQELAFFNVDGFTNIHNWWLEILVGYGVFVFIGYIISYILMIFYLFKLRHIVPKYLKSINHSLIAFLIVFIFASITSANNMLIEWHWVFFALIISYIKISNHRVKRNWGGRA